ncbi:MAG: flagella synthesis protein FlgN [Succinivibrio sp.]
MIASKKFVFNKVNPAVTVLPLKEYLAEQNSILDNLLKVISGEFEALRVRRVDALKALSQMKSEMMVKLQSNDQKIKLHPEVESLKTVYSAEVQQIKAKMSQCKYRNEVNGSLIKMLMQSNNKLKAALLGARDAVTCNMTYNDKGSANARGPVRLSVQA